MVLIRLVLQIVEGAFKCGYGEEWKRSAGLIKLLIKKFQECKRSQANTEFYLAKETSTHLHDGLLREFF